MLIHDVGNNNKLFTSNITANVNMKEKSKEREVYLFVARKYMIFRIADNLANLLKIKLAECS